jgi:hypothetical protein
LHPSRQIRPISYLKAHAAEIVKTLAEQQEPNVSDISGIAAWLQPDHGQDLTITLETLVDKPGFKIHLFSGKGEYFEIGASDESALTAFFLRRKRAKSGLTLAEVARKMGSKSLNTYARYEQGRTVPTVPKLSELLSAVSARKDFVLTESQA